MRCVLITESVLAHRDCSLSVIEALVIDMDCMITSGGGDGQTGSAVVDLTVFIEMSVRREATPGSSPSRLVKKRW